MIESDIALHPFQIAGTDLFHWNGQNFIANTGKLTGCIVQHQHQ